LRLAREELGDHVKKLPKLAAKMASVHLSIHLRAFA
jgi:hypothetical protein